MFHAIVYTNELLFLVLARSFVCWCDCDLFLIFTLSIWCVILFLSFDLLIYRSVPFSFFGSNFLLFIETQRLIYN